MFTEYNKFVEFLSYSLSNALILLIIFIVFGRLFIINWKNKGGKLKFGLMEL